MTESALHNASASYQTLLVRDVGPVRFVILNRPEVRNAIDLVLRSELAQALGDADADPDCRAIVLTGAGRVFCAGGDLTATRIDSGERRRRLEMVGQVARILLDSRTPVVAAVNGGAWGAGMAVAAACDIVVVGRSARMVAAFGRWGLIGDTGAFYILQQRVGKARAKEILLLNASLTASEAVAQGLATVEVDDSEVRRAAYDLARRLAAAGPGANAETLRVLNQSQQDFESVLASEIDAQVRLIAQPSVVESQRAFLEKREPSWWDDLDEQPPAELLEVDLGGVSAVAPGRHS